MRRYSFCDGLDGRPSAKGIDVQDVVAGVRQFADFGQPPCNICGEDRVVPREQDLDGGPDLIIDRPDLRGQIDRQRGILTKASPADGAASKPNVVSCRTKGIFSKP